MALASIVADISSTISLLASGGLEELQLGVKSGTDDDDEDGGGGDTSFMSDGTFTSRIEAGVEEIAVVTGILLYPTLAGRGGNMMSPGSGC